MVDIAAPTVFISYAHDSPEHKRDVLELATFLRGQGIDAVLDEWFTGTRQDWYSLVITKMTDADFVIVVASAKYRLVGDGVGPYDEHRGVQTEAAFLREQVYSDRATWLPKILPVLLPGHRVDEIPLFLQPRSASHYEVAAYTPDGANGLLSVLWRRPRHLPPPVAAIDPAARRPSTQPAIAGSVEVRWCAEILGEPTDPETVELHLVPAEETLSHSTNQLWGWGREVAKRGVFPNPEPLALESEMAAWTYDGAGGFAVFRSGQRSAWFERPAHSKLDGEIATRLTLLLTDGPLDLPRSWAPAIGAGTARITADEPIASYDLRPVDVAARLADQLVAAAPSRPATVVHNKNTGTVTGTLIQAGDIHGGITIIGR